MRLARIASFTIEPINQLTNLSQRMIRLWRKLPMSGHSKWKQIKNKKASSDTKKGALFTRMSKIIALAAKEGSDPNTNFKLRMAIDQAHTVNMPKDNIARAISRASGEGEENVLHEVIYEGYGPGGVAVIIEAVTDNLNRTVSAVRHAMQKSDGALAESNAVRWLFGQKGVIRFAQKPANAEALELAAIEAGADDIQAEENGLVILTEAKNLQHLKEALEKSGFKSDYAQIEFVPKTTITLNEADRSKLENLLATLDELEDVNDYYTNVI